MPLQHAVVGTRLPPTTACLTAAAPRLLISVTITSRSLSRSSSCDTTKPPTTCALEAFASPVSAIGQSFATEAHAYQRLIQQNLAVACAHSRSSFSLVDAKAKGWLVGQGGVPNAPVSTRNLNYSLGDVRSMCAALLLFRVSTLSYVTTFTCTYSKTRTSSKTASISGGMTRARPCECQLAPHPHTAHVSVFDCVELGTSRFTGGMLLKRSCCNNCSPEPVFSPSIARTFFFVPVHERALTRCSPLLQQVHSRHAAPGKQCLDGRR